MRERDRQKKQREKEGDGFHKYLIIQNGDVKQIYFLHQTER